jgi:tetratricopeptide (TPR) repeat protein
MSTNMRTESSRPPIPIKVGLFLACALVLFLAVPVKAADEAVVRPSVTSALLVGSWDAVASDFDATPPQNTNEKFVFAHACLALNRNNEAVETFLSQTGRSETDAWVAWTQGLAAANREKPAAHYLYGDALSRSGHIEDGIREFDKGLATKPSDALLLNARGVAHAVQGRVDAALRDFNAAVASKPDLADSRANIGSVWLQQKRGSTGAAAGFESALKLSSGFVIPLVGRGLLRTNGWAGSNSDASYSSSGRDLSDARADLLSKARADFNEAVKGSGRIKEEAAGRIAEVVARAGNDEKGRLTAALAADDPGTLIQRNLLALSDPVTPREPVIENLMALAVRYPDRAPQINDGIAHASADARDALQQYWLTTSHLDAMDKLASTVLPRQATDPGRDTSLSATNPFSVHFNQPTIRPFDSGIKPTWSSFADSLDSINTTLSTMSDLLKLSATKSFGSRFGGNNRFGGLIPGFDSAGDWLGLGSAVSRDLGAVSDGNYNFFSSHLLDQSASFGLHSFTSYLAGQVGRTLPDYWTGIDKAAGPLTSLAGAFGSNLGSGRVDSDTAYKYGDAIGQTALWNAQMQAGSRYLLRPGLAAAGVGSAMIPDLMAFASSRTDGGNLFDFHPLTVNDATHLTDAAVGGALFSLGLAMFDGNARAAQMTSDIGKTTAGVLRDFTYPLFARAELDNLNRSLDTLGQPRLSLDQFMSLSRPITPPPVQTTTITTQESYRIETQAGVTKITDLTQTRSALLDQTSQTIRDVTGASPGGFKTATPQPLWNDGEWPFTPWYGLGYPASPAVSSNSRNQ